VEPAVLCEGPYNDFRDLAAIAKAVQRPTMKFAAISRAGEDIGFLD
jgi:hypothetical protein